MRHINIEYTVASWRDGMTSGMIPKDPTLSDFNRLPVVRPGPQDNPKDYCCTYSQIGAGRSVVFGEMHILLICTMRHVATEISNSTGPGDDQKTATSGNTPI
jgi:hypothetical protein